MATLPVAEHSPEISATLRELGREWAASPLRPRVALSVLARWNTLIREWASSQLPLVIRKSGLARGSAIRHDSGRDLIIADNSPAQWAFSRAYRGTTYSLDEVDTLLHADEIPFTYIAKSSEKAQMKFKCTLGSGDNINARGWKLCHIKEIGLKTKTPIAQVPLGILVDHFQRFIDPTNHFLVPLTWAGLGELPEVIEALGADSCQSPQA